MSVTETIHELVVASFEGQHHAAIVQQLARYGSDPDHREVERVQAAVLHLAAGDVTKVASLVDAALLDYRDVLYWLTFDDEGNPPPPLFSTGRTELRLPPPPSPDVSALDKRLIIMQGPSFLSKQVAVNPEPEAIERIVLGLAWKDLTFVVLGMDSANWLEVSGSLKAEDGLSAKCSLAREQYVAAAAPAELSDLVALLQSWNNDDGRWRTMIEWTRGRLSAHLTG